MKPTLVKPVRPDPAEANRRVQQMAESTANSVDLFLKDILEGYSPNGPDLRTWYHFARIEIFADLARADPERTVDVPALIAELKAFADRCASLSKKMKLVALQTRARCAAIAAAKAAAEADRAAEALAASSPRDPPPTPGTQPPGEA